MAESTGSHEMKPVRCGCGGEAELCRGTTNPPYYWVQCSVCRTGTIGNMKLDPDESVAIWNRAMGGVAENATSERTLIDLMGEPSEDVKKITESTRKIIREVQKEQMGWEEPKWWCNLCACYDKQRCYCNLHGIWVASDFGCKAFEPYCEGEDTDWSGNE